MRAITKVTIREEAKGEAVTVYTTYNNNSNDQGVHHEKNLGEALNELLKLKTNFYFPLKTDEYIHQTVKEGKLVRETVKL